ncbi:MAG: endonuclease/exonuclease/phosphatase family protein [Bacteroidia bacterium]|nr:endonuclease/exonuclease/phosphatase family protein [Bacteroidia bacterium]
MIILKKNISFGELRRKISEARKRKLNWFNRFMLWLNYIAIVALLCSYAARFINPVSFWYLAFFGLAYPVVLLVNIFFILYWTAQLRIYSFLSLIFILLGLRSFFSYVQITLVDTKPQKTDVKVMSYNSMLFDLYNWSHNEKSREEIFGMLEEESPDILCLQEFYTSENPKSFNNKDTLTKFLPTTNIHCEYTTTLRGWDHWGIATLTKYPIVRKGKLIFNTKTNNICIFTDVIIEKDTVRIYNMHLQSIQFKKDDYKFVSDVVNNKETQEEIEHSKSILRRLKRGFLKRSYQSDLVAEHISKCKYKIIVCGDFNDTPSSYTYSNIRGDMKDAFIEKGSGFEKTYNGKMPAFRIDYILHSKEIETVSYKRIKESTTDHFPVSAYLRLK